MPRQIVMIGTDLAAPGGITAVVQSYLDAGLAARWRLRYLASFHRAQTLNKLGCALRTLLQLTWLLLTRQVAGVHAHVAARGSFWRKGSYLWLAGAFGVPTLLHLHDGSFPAWFEAQSPRRQRWIRALLRRVDRVACLSEGWQARIAAIEPRARFTVLPNPVHCPAAPGEPVAGELLFLGRLWPEKGLPVLLQAAQRLRQEGLDFRLVCAGDGDMAAVQAALQRLGLADRVSLPGYVGGARKEALLARAAVFVLPSQFEGVPIGVLEAMAWGVPVVATPVGGIPETLGPEGGRLVPVGDAEALTRALSELLRDPAAARRLGLAGRERAMARHAVAMVVQRLSTLYGELGCAAARLEGI